MSKKQVMAEIIRHTSLSDGIFDMTLKAEEIAKEAKAGQFISVYLNNKSKILPRPISICGIDKEAGDIKDRISYGWRWNEGIIRLQRR